MLHPHRRDQIHSSYRPFKELLLLPSVPARLKLKMLDLLDHMHSQHAGFTCLDLFMVRQEHLYQVRAPLTANIRSRG